MEKPGRPKTALNECVKVVVRCRPLSEKEKLDTSEEVVKVWSERGAVQVHNPKGQDKMFTYDAAYDASAQNGLIYDEMIRPLVASVMDGFNGCVFAYGQTGTGKTHTMEGSNDDPGIIPRAFGHMWAHINNCSSRDVTYLVSCSYVELYMEDVRDLLAKDGKKLTIKAQQELNGFYIPEMTSVACKSAEEMAGVMRAGRRRRAVAATDMNEHSSRSHAVFLVTVETARRDTGTIRVGKLNLVDLAGSERQRKTAAAGERLREAARINQALSSLGNVIAALAETSPHVPYRDSKLTRILQDSLGGNSKTIMVANIGPAARHYDETITTLRYAHRAKAIRNKPVRNEDPKDAKLREYQAEIERLKELIKARQQTKPKPSPAPVTRRTHNGAGAEAEAVAEAAAGEEAGAEAEAERREWLAEQARAASSLRSERLLASELEARVRALEERLVHGGGGGKDLINNLNESQLMLEQKQLEIAERRQREREMQQRLELAEESTASVTTTFTNLQQDTDHKTQRLKKCVCMYLGLREEMVEQREAHDAERRELEAGVGALLGALRRANTLADCLVPHGLGALPTAPVRRPASSPSRRRYSPGEADPRCRYENILQLAPVPLPATTRRYPAHTPAGGAGGARGAAARESAGAAPPRRARPATSHQRLGAGVR